ncbi:MAG: hypothetical protein KGP12_06035 [Actinomycetales bacterium]|nr:hypothetical protein [Actinomycetales bacterium]
MTARHLLVLADSLAFHGPAQAQSPLDPRLYPQVCARKLARDGVEAEAGIEVDLVARQGWTARDAWWALTKDPMAFGVYVHRADWLIIGVGGMDHLPAAVPTWVRDSIPYIRPGALRRQARRAYRSASPAAIRLTAGRMRQLPQSATDRYLSRIVQAVRHWRPGIPIAVVGPSSHRAATYPSQRHHRSAVAAGRAWAQAEQVAFVDVDPWVVPSLDAGTGNPDGMHWAWSVHDGVGRALAAALQAPR